MKRNVIRKSLLITVLIALIIGFTDRTIMVWAELFIYPCGFALSILDHLDPKRQMESMQQKNTREIGLILCALFMILLTGKSIHQLISQQALP